MTSYDTIWTTFLINTKASDFDLPQTDEKIYEAIHNGIRHLNSRLREDITWDDSTETLDRELSNDYLLILAHILRLIFLTNQKTFFENLWQPFQKDVGLKNFQTQLKSIDSSIEKEEKKIDELIRNMEEDYL